jgi:hypothetical protein
LHPLESLEPAECLVDVPGLAGNKRLQWARQRGLSTYQQYVRCIDWNWGQGVVLLELGWMISFRQKRLEDFDVVSLDANCHGSLDCINGHDEGVIACAGLEDALDSIEGATAKSHALANLEKGMAATGDILGKKNSNRVDLFFRNGSALAILPDKSDYAIGCQHLYSGLIVGNYLHEHVAGE